MKPSAPQKATSEAESRKQKQAQKDKQSDESLVEFEKDDTFLSFAERMPAYQSNVQYSAEEQVIFPFVLLAIVLEIIWHINHVDISVFSTMHAPLQYAFKMETICFSRGPWKRALMPSKRMREKKKERKAHFIQVPPLWKINVY